MMTPDAVFLLFNTLVLPPWLLMILLPNWKWTTKILDSLLFPVLLSVGYAVLIITFFQAAEGGGFSSLQEVKALFSNDFLMVAGWVHYLAFDLLVGYVVFKQGGKMGFKHISLVPCLLGTFMFGPLGFLLFLFVQRVFYKTKKPVFV
jgi:hypothetical protein